MNIGFGHNFENIWIIKWELVEIGTPFLPNFSFWKYKW